MLRRSLFLIHHSSFRIHHLIFSLILSPASTVESVPPASRVVSPAATHSRTARSTACAASAWPKYSSISAALRIAPAGFALDLPARGGALPCTGSKSETRPRCMLPEAARPSPARKAAPRAGKKSPKGIFLTTDLDCPRVQVIEHL